MKAETEPRQRRFDNFGCFTTDNALLCLKSSSTINHPSQAEYKEKRLLCSRNEDQSCLAYFSNARLKVPCPTREILEVRPRFVLIALQTVIETAVGLVVRLGGDVAEEADFEALLLGVEDVELPDGDAGGGEAQGHQAIVHQGGGDCAKEAAHPGVVLVGQAVYVCMTYDGK